MSTDYEKFKAYLEARKPAEQEPVPEHADYLMHYGVKGQKWGTRQWQNADGSYTEAGKHHYGWGYGRQQSGGINPNAQSQRRAPGTRTDGYQSQRRAPGTRSAGSSGRTSGQGQTSKRQLSQAEIEARKARTKKILKIGAGVAVAAALSYGAYKGYQQSTKLRDSMRADVHKNFNTDSRNLHTLTSKYWDSADRKKYSELSQKRANEVANSITRKDAVAAKFAEKTGLRITVPQSREKVLRQRRSENEYANFIRDAEKRGHMNKQIHDARQELKAAQKKLTTYSSTQHIGTSKQYETFWKQRHQENVEAARKRLDTLLLQRRAG